MKNYSKKFKEENSGKFVWFNGAMGIEMALANNYIENTREDAIKSMARRDNVSYEEVDNNYLDWYYIIPVEDIEDECINDYFANK